MNIKFRQFKSIDIDGLKKLIKGFYLETPGNASISDKKIMKTCHEFTVHPEKGAIIIFEFEKSIIGYSILFKGWSYNGLGILDRYKRYRYNGNI